MKKILLIVGGLILIILIFAFIFVYGPYTQIKAKAMVLVASAKQIKADFKKNDIDLLNKELTTFSQQYTDFENASKQVYWMSFIPYVSDFKNGVEAGRYIISAGQEAVKAITPYADLIGFKKGQASFVEQSAQDRLQTAVLTLDKVLTNVDSISADIDQADKRIQKIDPNRYPKYLGKIAVQSQIQNAKEQFTGLASLFVDAKPLLKQLPDMLGKNKEKTYLVLFQDDKELRATGGFLTAYGIFNVNKGKIQIKESADIYSLDDSIAIHPDAPPEILTYHKGVYKFYIRDSNLSPDLPTSLDLFNSLYKKSSSRVTYDGVITIDSKVLVDMLTIFGDTEADGIRFSAQKDQRCNCAQVLYQLFNMIDRPVPYFRTNRKGILGELMYALFYKAIGFSPSKYWGTLAQDMFQNLQEKHIQVYLVDPNLEASVKSINFGGTINTYKGDYLDVTNVNFAGAKSNLFVTISMDSKTNTNDNGKISREVIVDYKNPYPHSDCSLSTGGLCLNATLRNWVRVYTPLGSQLVSFQGSLKKVNTYDSLGKTVFEGYLEVPTQGRAQIDVKYTLPSSISGNNYSLMVQKQAGTDNQALQVELNGKTIYNGTLDTDKIIK